MKKLFLATVLALTVSPIWGQSVVQVSNLRQTTGATPTLTFEVGWSTPPSSTPNHRDTIWLFADYRTVNPDGSVSAWTSATITGATTNAGTLSYPVALPGRGFYLIGSSSGAFNATVTATLSAPLNTKFNACVYASDWPPNATMQSGGGYILKGTPPFTINGAITEPTYTFGAGTCITSITDSTGCPGFVVNPPIVTGSILTTGETVCVGSTPMPITGTMPFSGGDGQLSYSWYKDGELIPGATGADYTPPAADAAVAGMYTYTRKVRDNTCNITPQASTGSWVLTVEAAPTITLASTDTTTSQTVTISTAITDIKYTTANASGVTATNLPDGVSGLWDANTYTISGTPTEAGAFNYTVTTTNSNGCTDASANGTIVVATSQPQGSCTFTQPPVVGTFASFDTTYSASTFVSLVDERDNKVYTVVKIGGRWVMAQNLNYQKDLTWQANSNQPSTALGQNLNLIGNFWCPGGNSSSTPTSTLASCDVWGALYSWETAMSLDGKGAWASDAITTYCTGAANSANCQLNWGRTASGTGSGGRGICPENWHVPTDFEWGVILDGMEGGGTTHQTTTVNNSWVGTNAGTCAKSSCTCPSSTTGSACVDDTQANWYYHSNNAGRDNYGFRVLPAGYRDSGGSGFSNRGSYAYVWNSSAYSSTGAWVRFFNYSLASVARGYLNHSYGLSVRCIHD